VLFIVNGSALGFTPIVICGLSSHSVGAGRGLWVKPQGASAWSLVDQSVHDATDFWQTNFVSSSGTYELVYNVELFAATTEIGFGPDPSLLPTTTPTVSPLLAPTSQPTTQPTPLPKTEPTPQPIPLPTSEPIPQPTSLPTPEPTPQPTPLPTQEPTPQPAQQPTLNNGACFHGNGTVLLQSGQSKRISGLSIGDIIQTGDAKGKISFFPITNLPHANNNEPAAFVTLNTETGKKVDMTSDHYIPKCDLKVVTAGELVVGDCLFTVDGKETLVEISWTVKSGVYTAATEEKFIVVNGVVASPFSKDSHPEEPELDYEKYRLELERVNSRKLAYLSRKATKLMAKKNFKSQLRGG